MKKADRIIKIASLKASVEYEKTQEEHTEDKVLERAKMFEDYLKGRE